MKVRPLATKMELHTIFDKFKNTNTDDTNTDHQLNFYEYIKAIEIVREKEAAYQQELHIRHKTLPGFKEFYAADTLEPKDEKLNFTDFRVLVMTMFPDEIKETIKAAFDMATNNRDTIEFHQYEKSLLYIKNPDFKLFYQSDSSSPKDWYLTFDEWKVEAQQILPTASSEEFKAYFDGFKSTDTKDSNIEELKFEEFTKALMAVRDQ